MVGGGRTRHWAGGAAFYTWDIGMKRGDIRVLGAASYATPLFSTAFLILAGFARPSASDCGRGPADRRRRPDRGQGYDLEDDRPDNCSRQCRRTNPSAPIQTLRNQIRAPRCIRPRPVAGTFRGLPCMGRHDRLRHFASSEIGTEPDAARAVAIGDLQGQRAAGVIMPDLHGIDAVPMRAFAARQQKIDRGGARAPSGIAAESRNVSR